MSIFNKKKEVAELNKTVSRLNLRLQAMHSECDPYRTSQVGINPYKSYDDGVEAITQKYQGLAEYGSMHVGLIAEFRAGVISGKGIDLVSEKSADGDKNENEMAFLREVFDLAGLFNDQLQTKTLFSELDGKLLYKLEWDPDYTWTNASGAIEQGIVRLKFIKYSSARYKVSFVEGDPEEVTGVKWMTKQGVKELDPSEFVFRATGAWVDDPNISPSKLHRVLLIIDDLDRALRDWRSINRIFASPTPFFRLPDETPAEDIDMITAKLKENRWTIGSSLVLPCDYQLVGADTAGTTVLKEEILTRCRLVSGITGIPPHFIGLPDLMSNRSTATSMGNLVTATTSRESAIWQSALKELAKKAIRMRNDNKKAYLLTEDKVDVIIKTYTPDDLDLLTTVWMPLREKGVLSNEFVLSKTPGVNVQDELSRLEIQNSNDTK